MRDIGHEETEILLKQMEKRIAFEYMQAEKEIAAKLDDYLNKFKIKDELKQKALANGLITEQEYQQWRIGQIMMGKRWEEMRDALAQDFTNADKIAKSIAYGYQPEVYAINHDYGTFQVEKASGMDTSYTLYDRHSVEELMKNEDFIPAPGRKISAMINENKDLAWNKKLVQSAMMQGILQGESISKMATRLAETVGDSDRKAAIRNARTMTTGIENAGRMASYDRANDLGIPTRKQWLATLDFRTRHWHADLDGVAVDNDKPFHNEYGDIMYPGDPKADPANIFNCRCTMIASIKGFERDVSNTDLRHDDNLKGMSYEDWKQKHYEMESDSILKQDEIAKTMKEVYNTEYRKYAGDSNPIHYFKRVDDMDADAYVPTSQQYAVAESVEEAKDYIENTLGINTVDYDKISIDAANMINESITKATNIFGDLKSELEEIRIVPKLPSEAAYNHPFKCIMLKVKDMRSPNVIANLAEQSIIQNVHGAWSTGSPYHIIRHELGHAVQWKYANDTGKMSKISELRKTVMDELGIMKYIGVDEDDEIMKLAGAKLSYYALMNDGEFIAESVAEYMNGNPRETAKAVVDILLGR